MENQKSNKTLEDFQSKLNKLFSSLTLQSLSQFFKYQDSNPIPKDQPLPNDENFLNRVSEEITTTKKQIMKEFYNSYSLLKVNQIKKLSKKLRILIQPSQIILRDGIISLYSDLIELKQQNTQQKQFSCLLQKILQKLQTLFRNHFILKEIQKMDNRLTNKSYKIILSQKKINNSIESLTSIKSDNSIKQLLSQSQSTLKELQKNIYLRSIQNLIQEQVKQEEYQIQQALETCRICQNQFRLKILENHVQYCSKINALQALRQQIIMKQLQIIEKINQSIQDGNQIKIYKNVVNQFQETPVLKRRNSFHLQKNNKKNKFKSLENQLDQFLEVNIDQKLKQYRQLMRQRDNVEKKMVNLEKYNMKNAQRKVQKQNSMVSEIIISSNNRRSSRNHKTSKILSTKTKKSLFAKISEIEDLKQSNHQQSNMQELPQKQTSTKAHIFQAFQTPEIESDLNTPSSQKLYRSLTNLRTDENLIKDISIDGSQIFKLSSFWARGLLA